MAKDAYFFSHDSNARNDPKILSMRCDHGMQGYGMYWVIVEYLREQEGYKLALDNTTCKALAMQMHSTTAEVEQFIQNCIDEYKLFTTDNAYFWADSLIRRMEKMESIREKRKAAAAKRWDSDANAKQEDSKSNANAMQRDAKENKVNRKENTYIVDSEYLWSLYPEKQGKSTAMKKLPGLVKQYGKDQMERAIKRYTQDVDKRRQNGFADLRYMYGSTFFNSGYVDYLDESYDDEPPAPRAVPLTPRIVRMTQEGQS